MFGGHGSRVMRAISKRLEDVQLILACGHNARARAAVEQRCAARHPALVVGFTSQISYYMQLSDFFVGKPGPGSISEALQQGLPVIVVRNAWTMPQERYNTEWVEEKARRCRARFLQGHRRRFCQAGRESHRLCIAPAS